ncbi:MAG TPA: MipA/OmpV family protein [Microvirga sp.]|nr:MipA/OmpV family protein [Microvirga sp.]
MRRHLFSVVAAAVGSAVLAGSGLPARAADPLSARGAPAPVLPSMVSPGLIVTLTGNALVGPTYPGSDEVGVLAYPSLSFRRVGEPKRFTTPDDGLTLPFYDTPAFRVGAVGRFRGGRYLETDRRLFGLDDVRWAVEPGLFAEFWPVSFLRTRVEVRRGFNGHEGFVADLGADLVQRFGAATFSVGPRVALGDGEFARTYFGVTAAESAINRLLPPYRPSGGVTSVGALAALSVDWSERWSTTVSASYARLVGDAAESPIVRQVGSKDQFTVGASVSYSFALDGW